MRNIGWTILGAMALAAGGGCGGSSSSPPPQCDLDPAFGTGGCVREPPETGGLAVRVDGSGRVVAVGWGLTSSGQTGAAIYRFTDAGALDTSFGTGGLVNEPKDPSGTTSMQASAVALDASQRIVVAGVRQAPSSSTGALTLSTAAWRFTDAGAEDATFAGSGSSFTAPLPQSVGNAVAVDASGRLVIASTGWSTGDAVGSVPATAHRVAVERLNADGSLDAAFGAAGTATAPLIPQGTGESYATAVVVEATGRIVVGGCAVSANGLDLALWAFKGDGTVDTAFGTQGIATHDSAALGHGDDCVFGLTLDAQGDLVATGFSTNAAANKDMAIWRFTADGHLDTTFAGQGFVTHGTATGGQGDQAAFGVALDGSGRIVAAGSGFSGSTEELVVWRYLADGTLDTSFQGAGFLTRSGSAGGHEERAYGVAVDGSGRLVVGGVSVDASGHQYLTVWRITP